MSLPLASFINHTPFAAQYYLGEDQHRQTFHVAALRITYDMANTPEGEALWFADEQTPLSETDEYYGELNQSSVRWESDFVPYKPKCDVLIVNASAHAPQGRAAARWAVRVLITAPHPPAELPPPPQGLNHRMQPSKECIAEWEKQVKRIQEQAATPLTVLYKTLQVTGPRQWKKGLFGGWTLSQPEPALSVPMQYEYAYGGENKWFTDRQNAATDTPAIWESEQCNTVGRGFAAPAWLKAAQPDNIPAPQIEDPDEPVREFGKAYAPQGFGAVTRAWLPRRTLAGTYDAAWKAERWPHLPEDFDFAYWNGAHPDMQVPHLAGNETIVLHNLCPTDYLPHLETGELGQILRCRLPGHRPYILIRLNQGALVPKPLPIDTLIVDMAAKKIITVHHACIPLDADVRVLEACMTPAQEVQRQEAIRLAQRRA